MFKWQYWAVDCILRQLINCVLIYVIVNVMLSYWACGISKVISRLKQLVNLCDKQNWDAISTNKWSWLGLSNYPQGLLYSLLLESTWECAAFAIICCGFVFTHPPTGVQVGECVWASGFGCAGTHLRYCAWEFLLYFLIWFWFVSSVAFLQLCSQILA